MRNFKKLLVVFLFVLLVGSLTACSQMNKITTYFEDQGYVRYRYNNTGGSLLFQLHDALALEELLKMGIDQTTTETTTNDGLTTGETTDTSATTTTQEYLLRFVSYAFSNDLYAVVIIEFESDTYLQELLDSSVVLEAYYDGLDTADYVNGNCLLYVPSQYVDQADTFVEIFQGLAEPLDDSTTIEITTETPTTEAPTTTAAN